MFLLVGQALRGCAAPTRQSSKTVAPTRRLLPQKLVRPRSLAGRLWDRCKRDVFGRRKDLSRLRRSRTTVLLRRNALFKRDVPRANQRQAMRDVLTQFRFKLDGCACGRRDICAPTIGCLTQVTEFQRHRQNVKPEVRDSHGVRILLVSPTAEGLGGPFLVVPKDWENTHVPICDNSDVGE